MKNVGFIYDRGGVTPIGQIDGEVSIAWDRRRDDVSEARITTVSATLDCCEMLSTVHTVRHELVVYRLGERVWEGPITHIRHFAGGATIAARDCLFFAQRTVCKRTWSSAYDKVLRPNGEHVTDRIARLMRTEMQPWELAGARFLEGLDVRTSKDTAKTTRTTLPYTQYVWDDLDTMAARSGLDYVMVGRKLILFDTHELIGVGRTITDDDIIGEMEVSEYGVELAVKSYVTDNAGSFGLSTVDDDYYGPVELLHAAYGLGEEDTAGAPLIPKKPTPPDKANYPSAKVLESLRKQYKNNPKGLATALASYQKRYDEAVADYRKALAAYNKEFTKYKIEYEKYVADLEDQAIRNHRNRYAAPLVVRVPQNSQLNPDTVDEIWEWLVPGCAFPVSATLTCQKLEQVLKLDSMSVEEDAKGEKVRVIMSSAPLGSEFDGEEIVSMRAFTGQNGDGYSDIDFGDDSGEPVIP